MLPKGEPDALLSQSMMQSIFQRFDFSYPDGEQFWDRSGQLAFALREIMPGLRVQKSGADQRDFTDPAARRELYFGISAASFQSSATADSEFPSLGAKFLQHLATIFEVRSLFSFSYRHVMSRGFATRAEAETMFWPLAGNEAQTKLQAALPNLEPGAVQFEVRQGPMDCVVRFAILELREMGDPPWHLGAALEARGTQPISVAEFDPEAFMRNVSSKLLDEVITRLAPHLK